MFLKLEGINIAKLFERDCRICQSVSYFPTNNLIPIREILCFSRGYSFSVSDSVVH